MSAPVRAWVQKFDDLTVRRLERAIDRATREGQDVLPVYVNSYGGSVGRLAAMIALIDHAPITCATVAIGMAQSCGAALLACGAKGHRYVAANTEVMVHPISASTDYITAPEFANLADAVSAMNEQFLGILDDRSGKRRGFWKRRVESTAFRDHYLKPADVVKLGLADHIGVPRIAWTATLGVKR